MKVNLRRFLFAAVISAVAAQASIIGTTGAIETISAPASVMPGASVNLKDGQAFAERQDIVLASALSVNATAPGTYDNGVGPGGTISAHTDVDSYFVSFDSIGSEETYSGTLTFSSRVLGVIFSDSLLDKSDAILGDPGTKYPTGVTARGQDGSDWTMISANSLTVSLHDFTFNPGDEIRIVTAAEAGSSAPEPASLALMSCGILLVGVSRWRRDRRASDGQSRLN